MWVQSLEDPLEKEMATHFSILAWEIPWTEEPGGQQSMGLQRVKRKLATERSTATSSLGFPGSSAVKNPPANAGRLDPWVGKIPWRRKWQPTPVFFPGESHGQRSLAGYSP